MSDLVRQLTRCADYELIVRPHHVTMAAHQDNVITDLRTRLEKAEAERDTLQMHSTAKKLLTEGVLRTARNDALEEAASSLDAACNATGGHFVVAREKIRALKSHP